MNPGRCTERARLAKELKMNPNRRLETTFVIAALLAAVAGAAAAQEATPEAWLQIADTNRSREQVAAELAAAKRDGSIRSVSAGYDFVSRSPSLRSREAVRAETIAARRSGELAAVNAEAHAFAAHSQPPVKALTTAGAAQLTRAAEGDPAH
jgi:hypothetical protein